VHCLQAASDSTSPVFFVSPQDSHVVTGICDNTCENEYEWSNSTHHPLGFPWYLQHSDHGLSIQQTFARQFLWEDEILAVARYVSATRMLSA
jgi:hypothetical protein